MERCQYVTQTLEGARFLVFPDYDAMHTVSRMLLTRVALSMSSWKIGGPGDRFTPFIGPTLLQ